VLRAVAAALLLSYAPATELCRFADPRIDESSGVSAGSRRDDVFFTHNDSGDQPRFFAVDRSGATVATYEVGGASATDWEDMARGRDDEGRPTLFFGDIGDNFRRRESVVVYEVPEPPARGRDGTVKVRRRHELHYEDGPHDAEALLVHPRTGHIYVVTKEREGPVGVYRADGETLLRVGEVRMDVLVRRKAAYARAVTSGEIKGDGSAVVLRTPFEAFEWVIHNDVAAAFVGQPLRIPLPGTEQGEAIAYTRNGESLVTTSEGRNAPMHLVAGTRYASPNWLTPAEPSEHKPPPTGDEGPVRRYRLLAGFVVLLSFLCARFLRGRRRRRRPQPTTRPPPA
jgi:hypothetical protein